MKLVLFTGSQFEAFHIAHFVKLACCSTLHVYVVGAFFLFFFFVLFFLLHTQLLEGDLLFHKNKV